MNTNFKIIGLIRLEIKPKPIAPEADAIIIRPPELSLLSVYSSGYFAVAAVNKCSV